MVSWLLKKVVPLTLTLAERGGGLEVEITSSFKIVKRKKFTWFLNHFLFHL